VRLTTKLPSTAAALIAAVVLPARLDTREPMPSPSVGAAVAVPVGVLAAAEAVRRLCVQRTPQGSNLPLTARGKPILLLLLVSINTHDRRDVVRSCLSESHQHERRYISTNRC
jgi:hypothetical protein